MSIVYARPELLFPDRARAEAFLEQIEEEGIEEEALHELFILGPDGTRVAGIIDLHNATDTFIERAQSHDGKGVVMASMDDEAARPYLVVFNAVETKVVAAEVKFPGADEACNALGVNPPPEWFV